MVTCTVDLTADTSPGFRPPVTSKVPYAAVSEAVKVTVPEWVMFG